VLLIVALVMLGLASHGPLRRWLTAPSLAPPSLRARRRALEAASRGEDPNALQHRLLEYLCAYYQAPSAEATRRFRSAGHGALLDRLNARRYGRTSGGAGVDGTAVLDAVRGLGRPRHDRPDALPELYS
jgi:hypothetical protein